MYLCREWLHLVPIEEAKFKLGDIGFVNIANIGNGGCGYSSNSEALIHNTVPIPHEFRFPGYKDAHKYTEWANNMAGMDPCPGTFGSTHTHIHTHTHVGDVLEKTCCSRRVDVLDEYHGVYDACACAVRCGHREFEDPLPCGW